jgi:hypothetical protein
MLIGIPGILVKAHASICLAGEIEIPGAITERWPVLVEQVPGFPMPVEEYQQESQFDCRIVSSVIKIECSGKSGSSVLDPPPALLGQPKEIIALRFPGEHSLEIVRTAGYPGPVFSHGRLPAGGRNFVGSLG